MPDGVPRGPHDRDAIVEMTAPSVAGRWGPTSVEGPATLRLADALEVVTRAGAVIRAPYEALSGASWRRHVLLVHGAPGSLRVESGHGLERAWVSLVRRACPLPEFTRGLRVLGSQRGVDPERQSRFFAPLLQARRRLEDEADPARRVDAFAGYAVRDRLAGVVRATAAEVHPAGADRRALEAGLFEALDPLFAALGALDDVAAAWRGAEERACFDVWRQWVGAVAEVFAQADRGWSAAARCLPSEGAARVPRGVTGVLVISLGALAAGGWP